MALPEGDQEKEYSPNCCPALFPEACASSLCTAVVMSRLIPGPPTIGTVHKVGVGEGDPTQTVILFPSGYQAAEAAQSLFCARNSASTSRGGPPSSSAT